VERLEILNKEGAIAPTQLYDLRALLKDGELSVVTGKNAVLTSKLLLSQLMNIPFDENLKLEKIAPQELTLFAVSVSEVYNKASGQLGLIKAAELRKQSAEAALKVAKGGHYPSLFLSSNYNSNFSSAATRDILSNATETPTSLYVIVNGNPVPVLTKQYASEKISYNNQLKNNVFSTVNLGLRIPIFNSFQTRNRVNLARIDIKNNELLTENTRRLLRQEVEQAYLNMTNSWERNRILQQQAEAYAESFRAAEVRLNAGVGNTVDYLLAKSNLDRASTNLVISKYDYLLRKKVIEYYSFKTFN
jgi:outer membrane protein